MKILLDKIGRLPVGIIATAIGLVTLSNIYFGLGYTWVKYLSIVMATLVWLAALLKLILHFEKVKLEYKQVIPASLYATFAMLTMILGSFIADYFYGIGKTIWLIAIGIHLIHTVIFTYTHVIKRFDKESFIPTWFVTYDGLLVSTVVGSHMHEPLISKIIVIYGLIMFILIMPFMIFRIFKRPLAQQVYHTAAILMAPGCLILVSLLNVYQEPNPWILYVLYIIIFSAFIYIIYHIPQFFRFSFHPGFAGLTFPMAIGTVATQRFSTYLIEHQHLIIGEFLHQLTGIQLYLTTATVAFVVYNFIRMIVQSYRKCI
ncbi:TDT family transporter [Turicibacter sanguinis]|uniref:TDT family transporter n=1 Tax=Turicibacter sanguinis TaxID=154288 RepID=UPI00232C0B53|nr:TDT family transporter [Turicibacter sanguinis]MDB8460317.1 TDT family transporter [Turicibacter sanguinis]